MHRALRLSVVLIAALTAVAAGAGSDASKPHVVGVTAAELAEEIRQADRIVIVFREGESLQVVRDALVEDPAWVERLATVIEAGPLLDRPYCFCISTPEMEIYRRGRPVLRLTLHHETKLRLSGRLRGDYDLGVERRKAILDLVLEQKDNARDRILPPKQAK